MANNIGDLAWVDLTVDNAEQVKGFYQQVVGWKTEHIPMGDYDDFAMVSEITGEAVSGICHAKGVNADLPPMWLPYFLVADIASAVEDVSALGGKLLTPIKNMGNDRYVVIKDPAGAACALYQKGDKS
ncbi:VOC family protein [Thalassotalea sp. PLHSN55]|uniref:VOC family protein n=1 Tax=Thalassotalea sp. PLHSN55 TaxID=3435888 RepID=UPI003F875667